jgi:hypothetical protein
MPGEGGRADADGGEIQSAGTRSGAGGASGTGTGASGSAGVDAAGGGGGGMAGKEATSAGAGGADECSRTHAPCFEPCGGDPVGNWVMDTGCLRGGVLDEDCRGGSIEGTPREATLRLSLDESGGLRVSGSEPWNILVRSPRACLSLEGAEPCDHGVLFTSALLFASSRSLVSCQLEVCGSCECSGWIDGANSAGILSWTAAANQLTLTGRTFSDTTVPYCVQGDELWLGGGDTNGHTKVAYRFTKRSCTRTLPPCSERTFSECETTTDCGWGACLRSSDRSAYCPAGDEDYCVAPDCVWDPNQCGETGAPGCDFHTCEATPGCELGPPVARCVGNAWCGGFDVNQCFEPGCFVSDCAIRDYSTVSCEPLDAESCRLAQGCSFDDVSCLGTTRCWDQTNDEVCSRLYCNPIEHCAGVPTRSCSELSVSDCATLPGCRVEW